MAPLSSLTISRVLDGSDSHVMRMQLHLHLWGGKPEDPQGPIAVSCSHTCTFLTGRRAPAYTATGLTQRQTGKGIIVRVCARNGVQWMLYPRIPPCHPPYSRKWQRRKHTHNVMFTIKNVVPFRIAYDFLGKKHKNVLQCCTIHCYICKINWYSLLSHQIYRSLRCSIAVSIRKSFEFLQFMLDLTHLLILNLCVFPHLVEHLELHH